MLQLINLIRGNGNKEYLKLAPEKFVFLPFTVKHPGHDDDFNTSKPI